jgi:hypothetical protein
MVDLEIRAFMLMSLTNSLLFSLSSNALPSIDSLLPKDLQSKLLHRKLLLETCQGEYQAILIKRDTGKESKTSQALNMLQSESGTQVEPTASQVATWHSTLPFCSSTKPSDKPLAIRS